MRQPSSTYRRAGRIAALILVGGLSHLVARFAGHYLWFWTLDLYGETMTVVRSSPEVDRQIGTPILTGWPVVERYISSKVGEVTARVPIHGPRGEATLQLRAKNRGGSWEFQQLEAQVRSGRTIDLMPSLAAAEAGAPGIGATLFRRHRTVVESECEWTRSKLSRAVHVDITLLPSLPYEARSEWAKEVIRVLKAAFPEVVADPQAVIIAVTDIDMEWYSWRDDERFAVVSTPDSPPISSASR